MFTTPASRFELLIFGAIEMQRKPGGKLKDRKTNARFVAVNTRGVARFGNHQTRDHDPIPTIDIVLVAI